MFVAYAVIAVLLALALLASASTKLPATSASHDVHRTRRTTELILVPQPRLNSNSARSSCR
jgi:hypothetical protein